MDQNSKSDMGENRKNNYEALFKNMLNAFALHKIIVDDRGVPVDYEFVDANEAFENMTGLKIADVVGKTVTTVIPGILQDKANWISRYGKVALGHGEERFEEFSPGLKKWFHVYVYSPVPNYFATIFNDITAQKTAEISLREKIDELERLNQLMVGREMDMIKMKQELKDLKQRLDRNTSPS